MELNDSHKGQVARYMQFFKGKRERLLADRETDKSEFKSDRVDSDQVYNAGDVEELIDQYHAQVMGTLRQEIAQLFDFSAVYLSQVFGQAQNYGMTIDGVDVSLVEDQSRAANLHALDGFVYSAPAIPAQRQQLASLQSQPTQDLAVAQELQDLKEENRQMKERYQKMQGESSTLLQERSHFAAELEKVKMNFATFREQVNASGLDSGSSANVQQIEASLSDTKMLLDAKNAECMRMSQELNQRLGDSSQFKELKAIVKKKSDEVKLLKRAMAQHGLAPPTALEGGVELTADDD